jgi:hypothetical protein
MRGGSHATPHETMKMLMNSPTCSVHAKVKMTAQLLRFANSYSADSTARDVAGQSELVMERRWGQPTVVSFDDCIRRHHRPFYLDLIPFWGRTTNQVSTRPPTPIGTWVDIDGIDDE